MPVTSVRIIKTGTIPIEEFESPEISPIKREMGINGSSSVTLIKNENELSNIHFLPYFEIRYLIIFHF